MSSDRSQSARQPRASTSHISQRPPTSPTCATRPRSRPGPEHRRWPRSRRRQRHQASSRRFATGTARRARSPASAFDALGLIDIATRQLHDRAQRRQFAPPTRDIYVPRGRDPLHLQPAASCGLCDRGPCIPAVERRTRRTRAPMNDALIYDWNRDGRAAHADYRSVRAR